ncbi:MAG TPA: polysaccharide deacetylase family protein [Acidimicrobiales bacterium]|jgi:peptidoglycan/xylan/chitin deacetylase (PgdA/CDA1 family)|nr:polysaccharide deacetylase family protein [Acidimicrobiales bacterium]
MPRLTLTFDNGPHPETTEAVLRVLDERQVRATFFVVGDELARPGGRASAERARASGHWIGNHSMTHRVPLGEGGQVEEEIGAAQELLGDLSHPDRLFRPFGGGGHLGPHLLSPTALDYLVQHRYTLALWNCVPRDWEDPTGWAERARQDVANQEWTVLVLHDLPTGAMEHLGGFIDGELAAGVEIVQELPEECLPIRRGVTRAPVDRLVAPGVSPDA